MTETTAEATTSYIRGPGGGLIAERTGRPSHSVPLNLTTSTPILEPAFGNGRR